MVRDSRIKEYRFSQGSLIAAAGTLDIYSDHSLNGDLLAIQNEGADNPGSWVKTGSLTFSVSGSTPQTFYVWKSGTAISNTGVVIKDVHLPRGQLRTTVGSVLTEYDKIPLNSIVRVQGAGLGTGKSGLGLNIIYQ